MNNREYKESFITRIIRVFKTLFQKNDKQHNNIQETSKENVNETIKDEKKDRFAIELKVDDKEVHNIILRDNFLKEIEGNAEKLNMLSIDRLKKLEKYYDSVISENDTKIKKMKKM